MDHDDLRGGHVRGAGHAIRELNKVFCASHTWRIQEHVNFPSVTPAAIRDTEQIGGWSEHANARAKRRKTRVSILSGMESSDFMEAITTSLASS